VSVSFARINGVFSMKKGLALLTIFLFALPASAQPVPLVEDVPVQVQPVKPPEPTPYDVAHAKANLLGKPFVVFVGIAPRDVKGCVTVGVASFNGSAKQRIVVCPNVNEPDANYYAVNDDAAIRQVAGLEASVSASPFSESSSRERSQAGIADDNAPWLSRAESDAVKAMWPASVAFPPNLKFYALAPKYQNLYTMDNGRFKGRDIHDLGPEHEFFVSGGMERINAGLWRSVKGLDIPAGKKIKVWQEDTDVRAFALVPRYRWLFPVGTVAFDCLTTDRGVFEIRTQTKTDKGWQAKVIHKEPKSFPQGYNGEIGRSCASCHDRAESIVSVPGRIYLTSVWGSDERFSWRPFNEQGQLDRRWPIESN
jgi:hypothetical protein